MESAIPSVPAKSWSLEEIEERHAAILEAALDAIITMDHKGIIIEFNPAAERLFGYRREQAVGQPLASLIIPARLRDAHHEGMKRYLATGHGAVLNKRLEMPALHADGHEFTVELTIVRISTRGTPLFTGFLRDVSELKWKEESLRRKAKLLDEAQALAQMGSWEWDLISNQVICSDQMYRIFGQSRDTFPSRFESFMECIHPDDRAAVQQTIEQSVNPGILNVVGRIVRPDGTVRIVHTQGEVIRDAQGNPVRMTGYSQDITDRQQAEEALRASQKQLASIAATMPQALYVFDIFEKRMIYSNREVWSDLAYTREEVDKLGPQFLTLMLHPEDQERLPGLLARWDTARDGEVLETEYRIKHANGTWRWHLGRDAVFKRDQEGKVRQIIGTIQDITDRKRAEEEKQKLQAQVQHAQKMESLGILSGGIAHDFNNLLTSVLGYTDLAMSELPANSLAHQYVAHAVDGARRAAELTQQLLAYSGKGRFVVEPLDLSAITEEMTRLLQVSISKKCVIQFDLRKPLPAVEADAAQMRQVIMNLVINASEAIGDEQGVIGISTGIMQCDRAWFADASADADLPEGQYVFLEVSDTGCGMDAETKVKIFDPFFTTKFTGRGLGLSAVLGIVRGHKGAIKVYSEPGKGTSIKMVFPSSQLPARALEPASDTPTPWRGHGTVLIIDDEPFVIELARCMLEKMGFTVLTARNGHDGLHVFEREGNNIRLVLLDMTMPQLDGEETFRELRRLRSDVLTILSSGYNEQTATSRFAGKGLAAFIQKPYTFEELQTIVRQVLEKGTKAGRNVS